MVSSHLAHRALRGFFALPGDHCGPAWGGRVVASEAILIALMWARKTHALPQCGWTILAILYTLSIRRRHAMLNKQQTANSRAAEVRDPSPASCSGRP